ncbi:hypothetical protein B0H14DRAFT_2559727 [Mycena olivaceomarginata]|nr:hypothetical protein B0H14DRAFT_2559727 [Mycena olivaceomarginata]
MPAARAAHRSHPRAGWDRTSSQRACGVHNISTSHPSAQRQKEKERKAVNTRGLKREFCEPAAQNAERTARAANPRIVRHPHADRDRAIGQNVETTAQGAGDTRESHSSPRLSSSARAERSRKRRRWRVCPKKINFSLWLARCEVWEDAKYIMHSGTHRAHPALA